MNLLNETKQILYEHGKSLSDIIWFGERNSEFEFPIDKIGELLDYEYDNYYGLEEVNPELLLVGKDFWLERHSYDGSEWWEYKSLPKRPVALIKWLDSSNIFMRRPREVIN